MLIVEIGIYASNQGLLELINSKFHQADITFNIVPHAKRYNKS